MTRLTRNAELSTGVIDRFWAQVDKRIDCECWLWTRSSNRAGYGSFYANGSVFRAHRIACQIKHGPSAPEQVAMHACDNPACCNPDHLSWGSQADNNADAKRKGRSARLVQDQNPRSVLTPENVRCIRKDVRPARVVAKAYGVHHNTVYEIRNGNLWTSFDPEEVAKLKQDLQSRRQSPTLCRNGHLKTSENWVPASRGMKCRECSKAAKARHRTKRKLEECASHLGVIR